MMTNKCWVMNHCRRSINVFSVLILPTTCTSLSYLMSVELLCQMNVRLVTLEWILESFSSSFRIILFSFPNYSVLLSESFCSSLLCDIFLTICSMLTQNKELDSRLKKLQFDASGRHYNKMASSVSSAKPGAVSMNISAEGMCQCPLLLPLYHDQCLIPTSLSARNSTHFDHTHQLDPGGWRNILLRLQSCRVFHDWTWCCDCKYHWLYQIVMNLSIIIWSYQIVMNRSDCIKL